ncbi:tail fiber domain-containing protein [Streptococcus sp. K0074]|uniref:tail fiber domain-containing protein n=1 Tax=Streptococcus sp. K0074 TaxID=3402868 RepID=UPI003B6732FF
MDALTRRQFDRAMFAKNRTLAIRVGDYASQDIKEASFEYGYIKGDTYKPGGTCAGSGKITFTSIITTFNKLDILHPEIGLLVGDTYQWVKMGEYFINDIEIDRNRNTTTLELMDGMFKLNREYVTDLHFPAEVREVIQEICLKTGIELANDYFGISAMRYHVEQVPEGKKLSFRDMLSAMTQMIGMSCFFNREGKMEIRDLTESNITINADSYFLHGLTKSEIEYQIAGITCKTDKKSLTVGMKTGRSLELDNVFMTQSALNDLYYKLKNLTYYPYNLNYQGHLLLEVGQWVTIQTNKKETFKVPVLSQSFTFKGGLRGRISADSKAGNDTQYSYEGTITKQIKQQDGIEAKIQAQIEAADAAFDAEFKKRKKEIDDGIELAKAKAEEIKQELSDTINQRFDSFDNGPLQEIKRKAIEALQNAGASSLLAQEAKRIGLDSVAKLEEFKKQATSAQTALSGDLDVLKRTIANDIRPKQAQAEAEIAKQVEALNRTKNELAGVKSAQATYEESTTRRLTELTSLADGKASKSELVQTADELASKIASVQAGSSRNYFRNSRSRTFTTGDQATYDYRTFIVPDFWKNNDRFKRDYVRLSFDVTFPVALTSDTQANVHFSAHPWYGYKLMFKGGTTERQHFEFTIDLSSSSEIYQTNNVFIRFGTNFGFPAGLQVVIENATLSVGNYFPAYQPAYEDQEDRVSVVESNFKQRADSLEAGVSRLTEGLRTKADISSLNVTAENIRQSVKRLETDTQDKLNQKLSLAEFDVRAGSIRQEILNATKDKADKILVVAEAGKLREEFSSLRVGGTNLLKGSKGPFLPDRKPANFDNNVLYAGQTSIYMEQGQEYIISAKTDGNFTAHHDRNKESDNVVLWIMDKNVSNYQIVSDLKTGTTGTKIIWDKPTGIYHLRVNTYHKEATKSVWDVKIEKGNVATDWSPAPEDTDGLITEAKATFERTAQGLRTDLSAIQEYVNKDGQRQEALQRYTREESARQATAVRELVNRDFVGKSAYQEDVRGLERRFSAISTQTNNDIASKIARYKQTVDGQFASITSQIAGKANQADFQRVRETSQLYERIIGSNENDISNKVARIALTNQLFQVEVGKYANVGGPNMLRNSRADDGLKYWTEADGRLGFTAHQFYFNGQKKMFELRPGALVKSPRFIVKRSTDYILNILAFDNNSKYLKIYFCKRKKGSISDFEEKQLIYDGKPMRTDGPIFDGSRAIKKSFQFNVGDFDDGYLQFEYERNNPNKWGGLFMTELDFYEGSNDRLWQPAPEDAVADANAKLEATQTKMTQLAGSWAVQNINSAGDIISGINLGANGHNRFDGKLTHITGETLIDNAVIKSAMIDKLKTANFESGSVTTEILDAEAVTADKVRFDNAFIRKMITNEAFIDQLTSKQIFATKVESVVSRSTFLEAYQGRIGGFTIGRFDQGRGRWISGINQFSVGMGNGEGGSYNGENTAFWANWGYSWNYPGPNAWYVTTLGNMYCRNGADFHGKVDFSNRSTVNFYSQPSFSNGAVINGSLRVSGRITYSGGEWLYSPIYNKLWKDNSQGGEWLYLDRQGNSGRDWIEMNKRISDRRYKSNIQDSQVSGLDAINNLKTYSYRKEYDGKIEDIACGIMAQDVQKYAPEAFFENPDGAYSYRTFELVPYLIKAIQELNQKIEKMEKTIA